VSVLPMRRVRGGAKIVPARTASATEGVEGASVVHRKIVKPLEGPKPDTPSAARTLERYRPRSAYHAGHQERFGDPYLRWEEDDPTDHEAHAGYFQADCLYSNRHAERTHPHYAI
jgi:hypothetical protein